MTAGHDELERALPRMLEGDEDAFRVVYRAVHAPLLRYLTVLVGPATPRTWRRRPGPRPSVT